jgi:hypothetical protein
MKQTVLIFATFLTLPSAYAIPQQCSIPACPPPAYERCDVLDGVTEYQNCQARNRQEDNRYQECVNQREYECRQEQKDREEEEHEKYCERNPDAPSCK